MANTVAGVHLGQDTHANRPAATAVTAGTLYSCSDHDLIYRSDGSAWSTWATLSAGAASFVGASVYKSTDQTNLTAATATKVTFDTSIFDTSSFFDNANDRLTVPSAMKVRLSGVVNLIDLGSSTDILIDLYKNGTAFRTFSRFTDTGTAHTNWSVSFDVVDDAALNDYYEVFVTIGGTSTGDVRGGTRFSEFTIVQLD